MLSPLSYWTLLLAVTLYAFLRGRLDERFAAIICIFATVATIVVSSPLSRRFTDIEFGVLIVDLLALLAFTAIALRSKRFWPLWVAGFQLTSTFAHVMKAVHLDLIPQVYAAAERFWVYPIFLVIVVGTWRSHQRLVHERIDFPNRA
ncbi:MAG: hypothetical protein H0W71_09900 [Sphingomonas sp.]|nr:hypothetical protein [Sphingomonas sp.]